MLPNVLMSETGVSTYAPITLQTVRKLLQAMSPRCLFKRHNPQHMFNALLIRTGLALSLDVRGSTPEQMSKLLQTEIQRWSQVIDQAGITKQ